jgi:hypothetical protein
VLYRPLCTRPSMQGVQFFLLQQKYDFLNEINAMPPTFDIHGAIE